jgi:K+-transporting ATPase A subunit
MVAILSFKSKESGIGIAGIICFVIALIFFALFVMSDKPEFSNTIISNEGLWERLNLIFMYAPLLVVSIRQIIGG